ncbi:MAG: Eco57I restriction-modification methylase domain-containing protein [Oscillospiraceae bacterium]|jgi:type I restriction-modification system DNA methylase subunit|nr:Eco57I restriction-modification methylase domain-containing protein [Oscillospiraceae bacterium]
MMVDLTQMKALTERFAANLSYYKNSKNAYNEHSCRIEYIDPLLQLLGWDVANAKGLPPQYREVIAENYSTKTDRPDYSITLRGVAKFFVEAKKPAVDIFKISDPALQARKYGWNAKHKVTVLTNFEYLIIYDTTIVPKEDDGCAFARFRYYHYTEYAEKFEEIRSLISRDTVYSGAFDCYFDAQFSGSSSRKQQVDELFLQQINEWRVSLSNELYGKHSQYHSLEVLNDVVQEFINQIVFLRICEDKNLPLYHKLKETIADPEQLNFRLEELFRATDKRYNSGLFSGKSIVFDLSSAVVADIIEGLYYPQSPYLFSIIESNLLGKIYEMFLTEQLVELPSGNIGLAKKKDCTNRSIVTTPTEIVKYMTEKSISILCAGKSPQELLGIRIADIACGSGVFLEAAFDYLQNHCIEWYTINAPAHLLEIGNGLYKLPLEEKKLLLCSCVYGIDIDIHAVEVAKFSLLIKLIENETAPSVADSAPILPELSQNIFHGNALISSDELNSVTVSADDLLEITPFDWSEIAPDVQFDAIIGNPPYVSTEELHALVPNIEFEVYKSKYKSAYKQFDKYFIFLERAIQRVKDKGVISYIVPNKFFKIAAGKNLRKIISDQKLLVQLDDFGDAQLFDDKTIYSSILLLQKLPQNEFTYSNVTSAPKLWAGEEIDSIVIKSAMLNEFTWKLTTDIHLLRIMQQLEERAVPLTFHADVFNGIQTSAERPTPIYWFSADEVVFEDIKTITIIRNGLHFQIEKALLKPYFKPTRKVEKGLNSYAHLTTDKSIIFPYDEKGKLIPLETMESDYPATLKYLQHYYSRLVPKIVSPSGVRDVPGATAETWYQYGRTQALTAFINTPKLIVGVLSKEPMYAFDNADMLIASGGTAGYCAISPKADSQYAIEYIQAWLTHPYTEKIIRLSGSDFEGGFVARGTFILSTLPFVELDFTKAEQKKLHDDIISKTREIYEINESLAANPNKSAESVLARRKQTLISEIEILISKVYRLEFQEGGFPPCV